MNTHGSTLGRASSWLLAVTLIMSLAPVDACACENRCDAAGEVSAPHACCQQETEPVSSCCAGGDAAGFRSAAPARVCACGEELISLEPAAPVKGGAGGEVHAGVSAAADSESAGPSLAADRIFALAAPGEPNAPPYLAHCAFRC